MTDREIPSTPEIYTVWYMYVRKPDLIRAINKMIADGLSLDDIEKAKLFEKFFGLAMEYVHIQEANEQGDD